MRERRKHGTAGGARRALWTAALAGVLFASALPAQVLVDRIAARIEGDVIAFSEVREQQAAVRFFDGREITAREALDRLIEQWVALADARAAAFPEPAGADVERQVESLRGEGEAPEAFEKRARAAGLSVAALRRNIARQIYLARYLDYRFRSTAQVTPEQAEACYRNELLPELRRSGRPEPPLADVLEQIRELLTQRHISARAAQWLDEVRSRTRVEILLPELRQP
jgi:hypothetical protein